MVEITHREKTEEEIKAIEEALLDASGKEVFVDMELREGALRSLNRMLDFSASLKLATANNT